MKKLLLILVMLFTFSLVACDNETVAVTTDNVNAIYQEDLNAVEDELQAQIDSINLQIDLLEERIENLIAVEGLNGQVIYYEKIVHELKATVTSLEVNMNFNENLAPSYMVDENGEYVTFNELALKIKAKYFANTDPKAGGGDRYEMIPYALMQFTFEDTEIDFNDVVARVILIVEELTNYEYYSLSSNGIAISIYYSDGQYTHQIHFLIPTIVLINDMFTLNFDSLIGNEFESYFTTPNNYDSINEATVKSFYDNYVLNETYADYVLDFTE